MGRATVTVSPRRSTNGGTQNNMDVRYVNAFVGSIRNVFRTMLGIEVEFQRPVVKSSIESRADVSAVIGFSGDASGVVVLAFGLDVATGTASKFAGAQLTLGHPDFADALGELANMVAGGAKANFEGLDVSISLPSVITGQGHEVLNSKVHPSLMIPCQCSLGGFSVEVAMKVDKKSLVGAAS
ncbi:MAG: chemotaxis protein CheX [Phycisphaerales bacterium]|nr:chemotaxis protein CheX [Phycisphaerales bacterium]